MIGVFFWEYILFFILFIIFSLNIFLIYSMCGLGITAMNQGITDILLGITLKYLGITPFQQNLFKQKEVIYNIRMSIKYKIDDAHKE